MSTTEKDFRVKNGLIVGSNAAIGGNLTITGNLTVDGLTTTINSTTLTVDDKNIVLASGAADSATADGAGISIDGANATFNYVHSTGRFTSNKDISAGALYATASTASSSTTTGSVIVSGGVGIAKDLFVGESINLANNSGGTSSVFYMQYNSAANAVDFTFI